jgi:SAM-dependent methyltransferase
VTASVYTEPAYYDEVMVERGSPAMLPLEKSGWLPLYEEAAWWIPPEEDVVDLGCGTARFGALLYQRGHYGGYVGLDFSVSALKEARRYVAHALVARPRSDEDDPFVYEFRQQDLREWTPSPTRAGNCVYVCLETLEHIVDDVDLVRRVPPGHRLIFSVPNYDSDAHIRTFRNVRDVWDRFSALLTFRRWSLVDLGGDAWRVHLCETVRRADAW